MRQQRFGLAAVGVLACTSPAAAQEWSFEAGGRATLAAGAFSADAAEPESALARAEAWLDGSILFDNQIELGFAIAAAAERDHPRADPRGDAVLGPQINPLALPVSPPLRSIHAGLAQSGVPADRGPRAQLETAFIYASNPMGEISLGRQEGIAARFAARPDRIAETLSAADPRLDLTGLGGPRLVDRLSGPSAKLSLTTARVLGLQFGLSYTPDIEAEGLDAAKHRRPINTIGAEPEKVLEAGASFALRLPDWPAIVAGLTWSRGEGWGPVSRGPANGQFGDVETVAANAQLGFEGWSLGVSALTGDNGWSGAGDRGYTAYAVHAGLDLHDWALGLEIATSSDDLIDLDQDALMLSAVTPITEKLNLMLGVQGARRQGAGLSSANASGVVMEWTVRF